MKKDLARENTNSAAFLYRQEIRQALYPELQPLSPEEKNQHIDELFAAAAEGIDRHDAKDWIKSGLVSAASQDMGIPGLDGDLNAERGKTAQRKLAIRTRIKEISLEGKKWENLPEGSEYKSQARQQLERLRLEHNMLSEELNKLAIYGIKLDFLRLP